MFDRVTHREIVYNDVIRIRCYHRFSLYNYTTFTTYFEVKLKFLMKLQNELKMEGVVHWVVFHVFFWKFYESNLLFSIIKMNISYQIIYCTINKYLIEHKSKYNRDLWIFYNESISSNYSNKSSNSYCFVLRKSFFKKYIFD